MKKQKDLKRKEFLGKLDGFIDEKTGKINKIERNFQKKHLKAYLNGDEYFVFGRNAKGEPDYFKVMYTWTDYEPTKKQLK